MKLEVLLQFQTEHPQVRLPQPSAGLRAVVGIQACAHECIPKIFLRAHVPKQEPFLFQPGQHRPAALLHGVALQVRRTLHRVIEAGRVREVQPDMGQLLLAEIEQRAAHHRKQGRVVPGVIQ